MVESYSVLSIFWALPSHLLLQIRVAVRTVLVARLENPIIVALHCEESWAPKNWCFWTVVLEKTLESPLDFKEIQPSILKEISPECSLEGWCWSWSSNTLATWWEAPTPWKRLQCWERLRPGGEADNRGFDGWMASLTQWIWVWVNSGSWWWTGRPGVLQSMGLPRVGHSWATELKLNWTEPKKCDFFSKKNMSRK